MATDVDRVSRLIDGPGSTCIRGRLEKLDDRLNSLARETSSTAGKVTAIMALVGAIIALVIAGAGYVRADQARSRAEAACVALEQNKATIRAVLEPFRTTTPRSSPYYAAFQAVDPLTAAQSC